MMTDIVEYAGRRIRAVTVLGNDGWTWSYSIDDDPVRYSNFGPVRYQDIAVAEAIAAAKAEIDTEALGR